MHKQLVQYPTKITYRNFIQMLKTTIQISCLLVACVGMLSCGKTTTPKSIDAELNISVAEDEDLFGSLQVILENSIYKAVMRSNGPHHKEYKDAPLFWHHIRSFIYKSNGIDQAKGCGIDCNHFRGNCYKTEMVYDGSDKKTIRMYYHSDPRRILSEDDIDSTNLPMISEYTIYANSPIIKVKYVAYKQNNNWGNAFDIGSPGGVTEQFKATTRVFGQEKFTRKLTYHEDAYWQGFQVGEKDSVDSEDGGALNYKGHFIMAVGNPENGIGFGRVMPIYKSGTSGGVRIFKLLWDQGFETFPATGSNSLADTPSYTGYIFLFDKGVDDAIEIGKKIIDGALTEE